MWSQGRKGAASGCSILLYKKRSLGSQQLCRDWSHRRFSTLSLSLHLRQRRFRCGKPEGHVHGTVQLDGGGERGAGQCSTACLTVQDAETAVTVRLQRAHTKFLS